MPGVKMQVEHEQKHVAALKVNSKSRKGWAKGKMEGKGGPLNPACPYRGVRQRQWGMWVAEIREPGKKKRLWLGTYRTAAEAALIYDRASRQFYGLEGYQNLDDFPEKHDPNLRIPKSNSEKQNQQSVVATRAVTTDGPVLPSASSRPVLATSGRSALSSSSSEQHLRQIQPDYNGHQSRLLSSQSSKAHRTVQESESSFCASSLAVTPPLSAVEEYIAQEAAWRLQMGSEIKTESEEERPLEDWSDCSTPVTSAASPDSREYWSCLTSGEEPAWDKFPEILSLPNDLDILDEDSLIYFPSLV